MGTTVGVEKLVGDVTGIGVGRGVSVAWTAVRLQDVKTNAMTSAPASKTALCPY